MSLPKSVAIYDTTLRDGTQGTGLSFSSLDKLRVAEKLDLRDEGVARRYLEINGVWEDHIRYAMTSEDWRTAGPGLVEEWIGF